MRHRARCGWSLWALLLLLSAAPELRAEKTAKRIPVAQVAGDASFKSLVHKLAAFGKNKIGSIGGGPIMPGPDVIIAEKLTLLATREQLVALLSVDNGAVRAHIAREIIRNRPSEVALVKPLLTDSFKISIGSMQDTPPIKDTTATIAALIKSELAIAGL